MRTGFPFKWIGFGAFMLVLLVLSAYVANFHARISDTQEVWGQFGDFFGGVLNPILSFLSFTILLYTVSLQIRVASAVEDDHEEKLFDDRLFQLLALNNSTCGSIRVHSTIHSQAKIFEGVAAIGYIWNDFSSRDLQTVTRGDFVDEEFSVVRRLYRASKQRFWPAISSYYDSCEFLLEFIANHSVNDSISEFSLKALKSHMSVRARAFFFYVLLDSKRNCRYIPILMGFGFWDDATEDPLSEYRLELYKNAAVFHQS